MKILKFYLVCFSLFLFVSCATTPFQTRDSIFSYDEEVKQSAIRPNDAAVFEFAERKAHEFDRKYQRAQNTRMGSDGVIKGIASATTASAAFGFSPRTVSSLGLSSTLIKGGQNQIDAQGIANLYLEGKRYVEEAITEYIERNPVASGQELTQNGVTLYERVRAIDGLINNTLNGELATYEELDKAFQKLSASGAVN